MELHREPEFGNIGLDFNLCVAPSQCPNFRVWRYRDGAKVNLELMEQGGSELLEGNFMNI